MLSRIAPFSKNAMEPSARAAGSITWVSTYLAEFDSLAETNIQVAVDNLNERLRCFLTKIQGGNVMVLKKTQRKDIRKSKGFISSTCG